MKLVRKPHFVFPGISQLIIQCGNNRKHCFYAVAEYQRYLQNLCEVVEVKAVKVFIISAVPSLLDESLFLGCNLNSATDQDNRKFLRSVYVFLYRSSPYPAWLIWHVEECLTHPWLNSSLLGDKYEW